MTIEFRIKGDLPEIQRFLMPMMTAHIVQAEMVDEIPKDELPMLAAVPDIKEETDSKVPSVPVKVPLEIEDTKTLGFPKSWANAAQIAIKNFHQFMLSDIAKHSDPRPKQKFIDWLKKHDVEVALKDPTKKGRMTNPYVCTPYYLERGVKHYATPPTPINKHKVKGSAAKPIAKKENTEYDEENAI